MVTTKLFIHTCGIYIVYCSQVYEAHTNRNDEFSSLSLCYGHNRGMWAIFQVDWEQTFYSPDYFYFVFSLGFFSDCYNLLVGSIRGERQ